MTLKLIHFVIVGLLVLIADILTPLQFFDSVFYWIFIALASTICSRMSTYVLSLVYSIFIITGLFIAGDYSNQAILGHLSGIFALWLLTYFLIRFREAHRKEEKFRKDLEKIYDRIDEIIFGLDKNWNVTYKNATADKLGYTFINVGDNFFVKMPNTIGTNLEYNLKKAMTEQKTVTFTYETQYSISPRLVTFTAYPSEEGLSVFSKDITDIQKAQQEAADANKRLNNIINGMDDAFWAVDNNFMVIYANDKMINWAGKKRENIIGKNLFEELPLLKGSILEEKFIEALKGRKNVKFEMKSFYIPGAYLSYSVSPSEEGLTIFAQNITDYKDAKIRLQKALEERDLLLKELYHRIKNNLQIISSIVSLETDKIYDLHAKSVMNNIIERINSISLIHSKFHKSENLSMVNASEYISDIVNHLKNGYGTPGISIIMNLEDILIDTKCATPVGMIVNELVSNSFKYAFKERNNGEIWISCHQNKNAIELIVQDNGKGYPDPAQYENTFGMQLVKFFAEQINGTIVMENRNGAYNKLEFQCA